MQVANLQGHCGVLRERCQHHSHDCWASRIEILQVANLQCHCGVLCAHHQHHSHDCSEASRLDILQVANLPGRCDVLRGHNQHHSNDCWAASRLDHCMVQHHWHNLQGHCKVPRGHHQHHSHDLLGSISAGNSAGCQPAGSLRSAARAWQHPGWKSCRFPTCRDITAMLQNFKLRCPRSCRLATCRMSSLDAAKQ